jgi:hypothetical protein
LIERLDVELDLLDEGMEWMARSLPRVISVVEAAMSTQTDVKSLGFRIGRRKPSFRKLKNEAALF